MQNWMIDPKTGDYVMENGAPKQTDSLLVPAFYRTKVRRTQWLYAPDADYGSDFYLIKKRKSSSDASAIETVAIRALQPLMDDGRASDITVETTVVNRGGLGLQAEITDARGEVEKLVLPQI